MDIGKILQILGVITSATVVIAAIATGIWYVIYGRKIATFKDAVIESKELAATRKEKILELEKERNETKEECQAIKGKLNDATQTILELHASRRRLRKYSRALERAYMEATGNRFHTREVELHEEDFDS